MKPRVVIIILALLVIGGIIAVFLFGTQKSSTQVSGEIKFWGVDDSAVIQPLIDMYKAQYPKSKIDISYVQMDPGTYEQQLVDALAGNTGPDVLMFHNTWLPKHSNKILPLGTDASALANFKSLFPTIVQQDFAPDNAVWTYPLYLDTLALYYNQDIFDAKGISLPPKTWADLEKIIPRIREIDKAGRITKAAAAVGGSDKSIDHATDLLSLVMLQAGTQMTDSDFKNATFASAEGQQALAYYTKFASGRDSSYTWNDSLPFSLDDFAAGQDAIMFNYSDKIQFLKDKSPFLKFRVAPMLQPVEATSPVNFANYWGIAVSNKTQNQPLAQDFVTFLGANPDASRKYLQLSGRPPALRALIDEYISTQPDLGIFAKQALTARSWPEIDNAAVDSIFSQMIADVNGGRLQIDRALSEAASKVTDLMQRRSR